MPVEEGGRKIPQGKALPGDLLHGKPAELKRSFLYLSTTEFNTGNKKESFPFLLDGDLESFF
jgi:hypothetical protein